MAKIIDLLVQPVILNGKTLYPSEASKLDALTGDDFTVSNLQNVDYFNNGYQADLESSDRFVRASSQKWNSANCIGLSNVKTNAEPGTLLDAVQLPSGGMRYTSSGTMKTLFVTLMDATDDAQVLTALQTALGIELTASDYTLSQPSTNYVGCRIATFKTPYLVGTVYLANTRFESAIFKVLPDLSISGRVTYANTQQDPNVDIITVAAALAWNAYYGGWNASIDLEDMQNLVQAMQYHEVVFFNEKYTLYSGGVGNTYFNNTNGMIDGSNTWGYNKLTYQTETFENSDWFDFTQLDDLTALAAVTEEGFYYVKDQATYKFWLMVQANTGPISNKLNTHTRKITFNPEDYKFGISGSGETGTPNPTYKYRGYFQMSNALMQNATIYVRWMGE